jgi:hypothetical protein
MFAEYRSRYNLRGIANSRADPGARCHAAGLRKGIPSNHITRTTKQELFFACAKFLHLPLLPGLEATGAAAPFSRFLAAALGADFANTARKAGETEASTWSNFSSRHSTPISKPRTVTPADTSLNLYIAKIKLAHTNLQS